jgi:Mn-dependent DtxR family transcriptional regulator
MVTLISRFVLKKNRGQKMSLSPAEMEILETMLLNGNTMKTTQIAIDDNKEVGTTIMLHLAELTQRGYVNASQKDLYILTDEGKKVLGIQPITKENAKGIMAYTPHDKAFNFYVDSDKSFHMHAHSLQDFANKLAKIDLKAIEFHMSRNDFEAWFKYLGDQELTKKVAIIKERKITGEPLRLLLHTTITQHCQELMKLTEQITSLTHV